MEFILSNLLVVLIATVLFIAIVILLIRRKQLKLWFYRSFYGNYSLKYVNLFKNYFDRNPHPHTIKYEASHFIRTLANQSNIELSTEKTIDFQGLEFP